MLRPLSRNERWELQTTGKHGANQQQRAGCDLLRSLLATFKGSWRSGVPCMMEHASVR